MLGVERLGTPAAGGSPAAPLDENFARALDDDYWEKRRGVLELRLAAKSPVFTPRLKELLVDEPVTFKGPAVAVRAVAGRGLEPSSDLVAATMCPPGGSLADALAGIVLGKFGQGRVAYLPAGIDAAYYTYPYPYQRLLLAHAMRWAASSPPPLEVQAPLCVHATTFRQEREGRQRLLVHLYNDVNTTAFHGLPRDDVPLREETLPIHEIAVRLRGYSVTAAVQQPENRSLELRRRGELTELIVPKLEVHSIVVLEQE